MILGKLIEFASHASHSDAKTDRLVSLKTRPTVAAYPRLDMRQQGQLNTGKARSRQLTPDGDY